MTRHNLGTGLLTVVLTATMGPLTAGPADAAPSPSSPAASTTVHRMEVTLSDEDYQRLLEEGERRSAGQPVEEPAPQATQRPADLDRATPHRPQVPPAQAQQQANEAAEGQQPSTGAISTTAAAPIGDQPDAAALAQCMDDSAEDQFGRIMNRFVYCRTTSWTVTLYRRVQGVQIYMGETDFVLEEFAQGDDHDRRIRTWARVQQDSVDHDYILSIDEYLVAPSLPLSLIANCDEDLQVCVATRGPIVLPFAIWDSNDDWFYWDVHNVAQSGVGRDLISYNRFYTQLQVLAYNAPGGQTEARRIRCDTSDYFVVGNNTWPEACVFIETLSVLTFRATDARVGEVARHILLAQESPNDTRPFLVPEGFPRPRDKDIPGKYVGQADARGLHRIRERVDAEYQANRDHVEGACYKTGPFAADYLETGLPERPVQDLEECDEYPMASTLEGAAHPVWDFSVRAVTKEVNGAAGNDVQSFYRNDRILSYDFTMPHIANDQFWVQIVD